MPLKPPPILWTWSRGVGRNGVPFFLPTLPPSFTGPPLPCFPATETVGCLLQCAFPPGLSALAQLWPLPHSALKACLSAHRGVVHRLEVRGTLPEETSPRGPHLSPLLLPTLAGLGESSFQGPISQHQPLCHLRHTISGENFPGLWVFHPGQRSGTVGVPTLSALGIALTCHRSGKQPQAGLGRGPKGGERARGASADQRETKASCRANCLAVGWVPWLEGWPGLACPGRSQVGACSLRVSVLLEAGQLLEPCVGDKHRVLES